MGLKYIGKGFVWLAGVPARDLTQEEIDALGLDPAVLKASGMYEMTPPPKTTSKVKSTSTPDGADELATPTSDDAGASDQEK